MTWIELIDKHSDGFWALGFITIIAVAIVLVEVATIVGQWRKG